MKRCVIHFGMHKTGTSSIQDSFCRQLDNPAWKYLNLGGANHSWAITSLLVGDRRHSQNKSEIISQLSERQEGFKNRLLAQLDSNAENLIISAESLSSPIIGVPQLTMLRDLLLSKVDKILLVAYVRAPKSMVESAFIEMNKNNFIELDFTDHRLYPNYQKQFSKFDEVFGRDNVLLWKFEPRTFVNACVVQDFCSRLDISFPPELIKRSNEGLSRGALALLYTYHKFHAGYKLKPGPNGERDTDGRQQLMSGHLATLAGDKVRFSWASGIKSALENRREDIEWIEQRLGETLDEGYEDHGPVINSEKDLLCYSDSDLRWLAGQLGSDYLARVRPNISPEEVAEWMYALNLKLLPADNNTGTQVQLTQPTKKALQMDENITQQTAVSSDHSPRRIKVLAESLNAKSYLEIGVNRGRTFLEVAIPQKTAVDPKFLFDTEKVANKDVVFKEMTSDDFFAGLPVAVKYDITFIDGLHTFEQTYRDLCNSLLHSHDRTVFLIDDTKPSDVYSSIPRQNKAVSYRLKAGGTSRQWHGDVFKVIFAIHDFHPGLNYRTVIGSGNPQTIVWRSNSGWRKPLFNSLESISRLTYFDLLDHFDIMRACSEAEAIALCLEELSKSG